jgi:hypothetical protein
MTWKEIVLHRPGHNFHVIDGKDTTCTRYGSEACWLGTIVQAMTDWGSDHVVEVVACLKQFLSSQKINVRSILHN